MKLKKKLSKVFKSGYSIKFQNVVRRKDGEWHNRIIWEHIQLPNSIIIGGSEWFGFEDIEDCVDDCLKYLELKNKL